MTGNPSVAKKLTVSAPEEILGNIEYLRQLQRGYLIGSIEQACAESEKKNPILGNSKDDRLEKGTSEPV